MVFVIAIYQILLNSSRFPDINWGSIIQDILYRGDAAIRIDGEELGLFMLAGSDIEHDYLIRKPEFLKCNGNFVAIGRGRRVEDNFRLIAHD